MTSQRTGEATRLCPPAWDRRSHGKREGSMQPREKSREEPLAAGFHARSGPEPGLRILLVGKTGGGKSATGNTILGRKEFESIAEPMATTQRCQSGEGRWRDQDLCVIDTPGIFDSEASAEHLVDEIMRCIDLSRPGPHALVLVTQVGRFTKEDQEAAKHVLEVFGQEAVHHMVVLFTCKEELGDYPLEDYVNLSENASLQKLIAKCGKRFCGFNNRAVGAEQEQQVSELMRIIWGMTEEGSKSYSNPLYEKSNLTREDIRSYVKKNRKTPVTTTTKFFIAFGVCVGIAIIITIIVITSRE